MLCSMRASVLWRPTTSVLSTSLGVQWGCVTRRRPTPVVANHVGCVVVRPSPSAVRCMSSSPRKKARKAAERAAAEDGVTPKLFGHFSVALVGRPNVGKSTLFNRLAGKRLAIVNATPGTTRDWREAPGSLAGLEFTVIDTGGLDDKGDGGSGDADLDKQMLPYTSSVLRSADVALFLVDGRQGLTPEDAHFAHWVRQQRKDPTFLVVNKTEGLLDRIDSQETWDVLSAELAELGFGEPTPISAEHGEGLVNVFELLEPFGRAAGVDPARLAANQQQQRQRRPKGTGANATAEHRADRDICLAIVGRPNVGKSTLVNRLVGDDRVLTGPTPGVTRDAVRVQWEYNGNTVHLVDTAGIRRLGMWNPTAPLESLSVSGATKALEAAHVAALVLDGGEPPTRQDLAIAERILEEGRGLVVLLNKVDLLDRVKDATRTVSSRLEQALVSAQDVHCIPISAKDGDGLGRIMPAVLDTYNRWNTRVPTGRLNRWLGRLSRHHPPPMASKTMYRRIAGLHKSVPVRVPLRVKYMSQINTRPPTFVVWANRDDLPVAYRRFLIRSLRDEFGLHSVPVRLLVRTSKKNPFKANKK